MRFQCAAFVAFLVALSLAWALPALATPSCQMPPCHSAAPPFALHWLVEGDVGQGGTAANETAAQFKADLSIAKDGGPNNLDISAFYCQGGGGIDSSTYSDSTINWPKVWAGQDCIGAHYNNIGILNQRIVDQHGTNGGLGNCGSTTQPYDSFMSYLLVTPGSLESPAGGPAPAIYHEQATSEAIGDRLFQAQSTNCTSDGQPNPGYVINLASPFTKTWEDSYTQGCGAAGGGCAAATYGTGSGNKYPWSGACVDGQTITNADGVQTNASLGCLDNYPIILGDRQAANRACVDVTNLNGFNGGFLEAPMPSTGAFYDDLPGLDANRYDYYSQSRHRSMSWNPNGLFLYQLNSGDCQDSSDPSFPTVQTTNGPSSFIFGLPPNVISINAEDTIFDPNTCGNWTSANLGTGAYGGQEPRRWSGRSVFTVNSAFTLYSLHVGYVEEVSCSEPVAITVPPGSQPNNSTCNASSQPYAKGAGLLDLSLRYWEFGIGMLTWNPQYGYQRPELFPTTNADEVCAMPSYAEDQIVVADPDVIPGGYVWGSAPTGFCNGSSGGALTSGPGESGGIQAVYIPGTCGNATGATFFTKVGVASRLFYECWIKGKFVGSCGVIVNFRGNNDTTCNQCYVDTVQNAFTHISGADRLPTGSFHHIMNITNPLDVEEGGTIDVTNSSTKTQQIALSNATDNTLNRCTQGIDWDYTLNSGVGGVSNGKVSVCELSAVVVFP